MLTAAYPRADIGKDTVKVYTMALADIDADLLQAAVLHHLTNHKWFPTVAELRKAAADIVNRGDGQPDAYEAWGEVMRQVRHVGSWGNPAFTGLTAKALDAIGGYKFVCLTENITADRARFIAAYNQFRERQIEEQTTLPSVNKFLEQLADGMRQPDWGKRLSPGEEEARRRFLLTQGENNDTGNG